MTPPPLVRPLRDDERGWLGQQLTRSWGAPQVVTRGRVHEAARLPALACVEDGEIAGVATFDIRDAACELVTLDAFAPGRGVGSRLLDAVAAEARRRGCRRLWLITTNDNLRALRFYQRRGLRLVAVHPGAVDDARRIKPSISLVGDHGIPIRDELELELPLIAPERDHASMSYAKKNLREVTDSAVEHGLSATQEARFPRGDLGAEQTGMNFLVVKPGQREAFAHRHRTAEEIYVVLAGGGRVKLDDELVELAPLDAVRVSPGVTRSFEAGPDGLEVLIFGPHVESDGEIVKDFWSE
jgi:mannose-6-phosphate isomerase-like protein (cupin superfamily)/GNAT superfamily N-acetyltransferase